MSSAFDSFRDPTVGQFLVYCIVGTILIYAYALSYGITLVNDGNFRDDSVKRRDGIILICVCVFVPLATILAFYLFHMRNK
jgi:membrane protein DedA with SNARE-associated domain